MPTSAYETMLGHAHMILGVTTSTERGSVAIVHDGVLLAQSEYDDARGHAERIFDHVDEALQCASVARKDLQAIGCDIGPGSFAGVRIGLASAKGMALGLNVPLIGVHSLQAMAYAATMHDAGPRWLVPVIDAKRNENFVAVYQRGREGAEPAIKHAARHVPVGETIKTFALTDSSNGMAACDVALCGHAAKNLTTHLRRIVSPDCNLPRGEFVARYAELMYGRKQIDAVTEIEPHYVRPPSAIRKA